MGETLVKKLMNGMAAVGNTPVAPLRDVLIRAAGHGFDAVYSAQLAGRKTRVLHPLSRLIAEQVGDPLTYFDTSDVAAFRAEFEGMLDYLPKRVSCATEDRVLTWNGIKYKARTFHPRKITGATKVIYLHGGGFVLGAYNSNDPECSEIALRTGCEVTSIGYPLSPEHTCPVALDVVEHALGDSEFTGGSPFVLIGESAGANLALSTLQNSPVLSKRCIGLVLVYPYLDLTLSGESMEEFKDGYFLTKGLLAWFGQHYIGPDFKAEDTRVSPLFGDMTDLPPALTIVGEFDPLCSDAVRFSERHAGTRLEIFPGMIHGFLQLRGLSPARNRALRLINDFVRSR